LTKRAFTFPGQGSQVVGMGKELVDAYPEAKAVFDEVDDALGYKLSTVMFEGPEETLRLTENTQPAMMTMSVAIMRVLETKGITVANHAAYVAGHSLGEYTALCVAGTFTLADTARLLRTRGKAMQEAVPVGVGAMAALLGLTYEDASEIAARAAHLGVCDVANDNAPGQVVVSGHTAAVERAVEMAKEKGARHALILPVSAPFHSYLMRPAALIMTAALNSVEMRAPVVPLVANVLARPITGSGDIRGKLIDQVTGIVRWRESVAWLASGGGVTALDEFGSRKVLTGLAKRINKDVVATAIGSPEDIEAYVAAFDDEPAATPAA
jgi:[acyl-carrier-protein] S-malonyltransferase